MIVRAITIEQDGYAFRFELDPTDEHKFRWHLISTTVPHSPGAVSFCTGIERSGAEVLHQCALTILGLEAPQQPCVVGT